MQSVYMADSRLIRFSYLFARHSYKEWILGQIQLDKLANLNIFVTRSNRHFVFHVVKQAIKGSDTWLQFYVFPHRGKHISLVICVRGNTYHGETHITVTPEHAYNYCYITENCFVFIAQCDIT